MIITMSDANARISGTKSRCIVDALASFPAYRMTHLSLHIHDGHGVGSVADDELFNIARQQMDTVHCDVAARRAAQGLEGAHALRALHIPHLYGSVRTRTEIKHLWCPGFSSVRRTHLASFRPCKGNTKHDPGLE